MYHSLSASEWKTYLGLPENYQVDTCIIYGSRNIEKYSDLFKQSAQQVGFPIVQESSFTGFMHAVQSYLIADQRIWLLVEYGGVRLSEYLHLACLFGSQCNIFLGSCGGLNPHINNLDIIIPTYSYGNESSTRMYTRSGNHQHYSDAPLSDHLTAQFDSEIIHRGPLITCGAMLAETQADIDQRSHEGYYGVEMESSTVFAISHHFSIPSAALVYVADNLIAGQTIMSDDYVFVHKQKNDRISQMFQVALMR